MYNTEFVCTYVFYDHSLLKKNPKFKSMSDNLIEESKKGNTEEELKNISDFLYKNELLYALNIPDFNEELVNRKITALIDTNNDSVVTPEEEAKALMTLRKAEKNRDQNMHNKFSTYLNTMNISSF